MMRQIVDLDTTPEECARLFKKERAAARRIRQKEARRIREAREPVSDDEERGME